MNYLCLLRHVCFNVVPLASHRLPYSTPLPAQMRSISPERAIKFHRQLLDRNKLLLVFLLHKIQPT